MDTGAATVGDPRLWARGVDSLSSLAFSSPSEQTDDAEDDEVVEARARASPPSGFVMLVARPEGMRACQACGAAAADNGPPLARGRDERNWVETGEAGVVVDA